MSISGGEHISYWLGTTPCTSYPSLGEDIKVDAAVIGGGMAGLTAALLLSREGRSVAVIERRRVVTGVTGYTTAKLTSQHGLVYKDLIDKFGEEMARLYAQANQAAISKVTEIAGEYNIDCEIQRMPSYTYALDDGGRDQLRAEAEAARQCGLPAVYTDDVPLPYRTAGAVRFDDQAIFHPRKYLLAVAGTVVSNGGRIYENTTARDIDEDDTGCTVTCTGGVVRARDVIIATNYPIKDPNLFFARLTTRQSYAVAVRMDMPFPGGFFYSTEEDFHSLRPHRAGTKDEMVLIGGEEHPAGQGGDTAERYARLEDWAREHFPVTSVEYSWSTHDAQTFDNVPVIGKLTPGSKHLYVATGFKGWGMTHSTIAGMLLTDEILGRENPWARLYNPSRIQSYLSGEMLSYNVGAVSVLIKGKLANFQEGMAGLGNGEARVIEADGQKMAVYKDEQGGVHAISASCTHMGCIVNWNNAEETWDCPCHGSRYDIEGRVIQSPAVRNLQPYEPS